MPLGDPGVSKEAETSSKVEFGGPKFIQNWNNFENPKKGRNGRKFSKIGTFFTQPVLAGKFKLNFITGSICKPEKNSVQNMGCKKPGVKNQAASFLFE